MLQDDSITASFRGIAVVRDIGRYLVADSINGNAGRVLSCELASTGVSLESENLPPQCEIFYYPGYLDIFKSMGVLVDSDRRLVYVCASDRARQVPPSLTPLTLTSLAQLRGRHRQCCDARFRVRQNVPGPP
jgi:hypothetical protein